jgi:hypothetical protein
MLVAESFPRVGTIERRDREHQSAESGVEHRTDLDPDRLSLVGRELRKTTDRVDDRDRRQETRDDREQDRRPDGERCDEREREQRPPDRAEVVLIRSKP